MRTAISCGICLIGLAFSFPSALGQQVVMQPAFAADNPFGDPFAAQGATAHPVYDFSNLVLARFDEVEGEPGLIFLVEQFREEEKEVTVTVVKPETRTRTRTVVRIVDGKQVSEDVTEEYVVQVPARETRTIVTKVPAGEKPKSIPLRQMSVYRLDGEKVTAEQLQNLLKRSTPVFVTNTTDVEPASRLLRRAMRENTLVVSTQAMSLPKAQAQRMQINLPVPGAALPPVQVDRIDVPRGLIPAVQDFR